jgi:NADPH2:quinone reductase
MKAVRAEALGPPETYRLVETPSRPPGPGEARIGVHFAGVSFVDVLTAAGGYQVKPPTPFTPGSEFSGIVLEVGAEVRSLAPGERVAASAFGGVFAEEITIPASVAVRLPDGFGLAEASVSRSSYLTACYALGRVAKVQPGETVLVLGAGGAVGAAAVQLTRHYGAIPIASASSPDKRALALACGAAAAVDSGAADWRDQVKAAAGGKGVDVVVDPVGGAGTERAFRSLAWKGRHLVIGFSAGEIPRLPVNLALLKGAALMGVDTRQFGMHEPAAMREVAEEVAALTAAGVVRPPIARVFPLEAYADAMRLAAAGTAAGRVLIRMPAADAP